MNFKRSGFSIKAFSGIVLCSIILSGCGGSSTSSTANTSASAISPTAVTMRTNVTGLTAGTQLSLINHAGETLKVSSEGSYTFTQPAPTTPGVEPQVMITSQPADHVCSPANGSGRVFGTNNYNANIVCSDKKHSYTIGGRLDGLEHHSHHIDLVISDNDGATLRLDHDGKFRFPDRIARNGSYRVVVDKQPLGRVCSISNAAGSGVLRDVTNIDIDCSAAMYTIGGKVTGLVAGQVVSIKDGSNRTPLVINANGNYAFPIAVAYQGSFNVTVVAQPSGGVCTVVNGQGHNVHADVPDVNVICTPNQYTVSGTVTGLSAGEQVTLQNNGTDDLTVSTNQKFTFSTPLAYGSAYSVIVSTQPSGEICAVQNGSGSDVQANVSTVAIACTTVPTVYVEKDLYTFTGGTNGANPNGGLISDSAGNLYGVTMEGGVKNVGTVFKLTPISGGYTQTILYSFTNLPDGAYPWGQLVMDSSGNIYGTTENGGTEGVGIVFKLSPTSSGYVETILYSFKGGNDGSYPFSGLLLDPAGNLYGTTQGAGPTVPGTVFKLIPSGTGFTESVLHVFQGGSDGEYPIGNLIIDAAGNIFGTTDIGGINNGGIAYKLSPSSSGYSETILYAFGAAGDASNPSYGLTMDSVGNLYGTSGAGGVNSGGTVFRLSPSGNVYLETILHYFGSTGDGRTPLSGLILDGAGNLYGTTYAGGTGGGIVFRLNPKATGYTETILYEFSVQSDEALYSLMMDSAGNLYGTSFGKFGGLPGSVYELTH